MTDGKEGQKTVALVPILICVLDTQRATALGTPDLKGGCTRYRGRTGCLSHVDYTRGIGAWWTIDVRSD